MNISAARYYLVLRGLELRPKEPRESKHMRQLEILDSKFECSQKLKACRRHYILHIPLI